MHVESGLSRSRCLCGRRSVAWCLRGLSAFITTYVAIFMICHQHDLSLHGRNSLHGPHGVPPPWPVSSVTCYFQWLVTFMASNAWTSSPRSPQPALLMAFQLHGLRSRRPLRLCHPWPATFISYSILSLTCHLHDVLFSSSPAIFIDPIHPGIIFKNGLLLPPFVFTTQSERLGCKEYRRRGFDAERCVRRRM